MQFGANLTLVPSSKYWIKDHFIALDYIYDLLKLTGFMIHVLPGLLLNSSTKRWYSLGSAKVQGKKSHLDASTRPTSLSRFFLYLLRFFTMRFLRLSCNIKHRKRQDEFWFEGYKIISVEIWVHSVKGSPHNGCESGLFLHVPPCTSDQNSPWASLHHTSGNPTLHHCEKK